MPLVEKYIKVCEELGLEQDKELNEQLKSTINYKMLYLPGDLEDYSSHFREGIIITRFAIDKNSIYIWDDYIMRNGKAYSNKGNKPTVYKTMHGVKARLQRVIHSYQVYVKQWKEKIIEAKIAAIQEDFK
jgi:hypothetical protein